MKKFLPIICLLTISGGHAISQSMQPCVVNASGGYHSGTSYSFEWSIGELVLVNEMTANDGNCILTNGFLQPFVKNERVINTPAALKDHEIRILRNPVRDMLGVQFVSDEKGTLILAIYDEMGHIQYYDDVNVSGGGVVEYISMLNYANGNYLLKAEFINSNPTKNKKGRSYKIIKIH